MEKYNEKIDSEGSNQHKMTKQPPPLDKGSPKQLFFPSALVSPRPKTLVNYLLECPDGSKNTPDSSRMLKIPRIKNKFVQKGLS